MGDFGNGMVSTYQRQVSGWGAGLPACESVVGGRAAVHTVLFRQEEEQLPRH